MLGFIRVSVWGLSFRSVRVRLFVLLVFSVLSSAGIMNGQKLHRACFGLCKTHKIPTWEKEFAELRSAKRIAPEAECDCKATKP